MPHMEWHSNQIFTSDQTYYEIQNFCVANLFVQA